MKQFQLIKPGSIRREDPESEQAVMRVVDVPLRELEPDEVKIKVAYCAICGSDPHAVVRNTFGWELPFGLGHEISGIVVELGEKATNKGTEEE